MAIGRRGQVGLKKNQPLIHHLARQTEFLWCATSRRQHRLPSVGPTIGCSHIKPSSSARDLGVFIDSDLSLQTHVNRTVSCCFNTLRQLRNIRQQVPTAVFQSLVVALVLSRLDYTATVCWLGCLPTWFVVFSRFRTRQHGSFTGWVSEWAVSSRHISTI